MMDVIWEITQNYNLWRQSKTLDNRSQEASAIGPIAAECRLSEPALAH